VVSKRSALSRSRWRKVGRGHTYGPDGGAGALAQAGGLTRRGDAISEEVFYDLPEQANTASIRIIISAPPSGNAQKKKAEHRHKIREELALASSRAFCFWVWEPRRCQLGGYSDSLPNAVRSIVTGVGELIMYTVAVIPWPNVSPCPMMSSGHILRQ
jgi:hypothetical protein